MGLTEGDKKAIRSVWNEFCKSHPDYGMTIFHAFLLKHPQHLNLFRDFRGRTLRSLSGHPKFKELLQVALNVALLHHRRRDVKVAYFTSFSHTLIDVLVTEHKNLMTPETKAAWRKLLEAFVRLVSVVYSEASRDAMRPPEGYKPDLPSSNDHDPGPAAQPSSLSRESKDSLGRLNVTATDTASGSNASIAPPGHDTKKSVHDTKKHVHTSDTDTCKDSGSGASVAGAKRLSSKPTSIASLIKLPAEGMSGTAKGVASQSINAKGTSLESLRPEKAGADVADTFRRGSKMCVIGKAASHTKEGEHELVRKARKNSESKKGSHSAAVESVVSRGSSEVNPSGKVMITAGPSGSDAASVVTRHRLEGATVETSATSIGSTYSDATLMAPPKEPVDEDHTKRARANAAEILRRGSHISVAGKDPSHNHTKQREHDPGHRSRRTSESKKGSHSGAVASAVSRAGSEVNTSGKRMTTAGPSDSDAASVAARRWSEVALGARAAMPLGPTYSDATSMAPSSGPAHEDPKKRARANSADILRHDSKISIPGKVPSHTKKGEHDIGHKNRSSSESNTRPNSVAVVTTVSQQASEVKPKQKCLTTAGPTDTDAASVVALLGSVGTLSDTAEASLGPISSVSTILPPTNEPADVDPKKRARANSAETLRNGSKISITGKVSSHTKKGEHDLGHKNRRSSESNTRPNTGAVATTVSQQTSEAKPKQKCLTTAGPTDTDAASVVALLGSVGTLDDTAETSLGPINSVSIILPPTNEPADVDPKKKTAADSPERLGHGSKISIAGKAPSHTKKGEHDLGHKNRRRSESNTRPDSGAVATTVSQQTSEAKPKQKCLTTAGPTDTDVASVVALLGSVGTLGDTAETSLGPINSVSIILPPTNEPADVEPKKKTAADSPERLGHGSKISVLRKASSHPHQGEHERGHKIPRTSEYNRESNSAAKAMVISLVTSEEKPTLNRMTPTRPSDSDVISGVAPRMLDSAASNRTATSLGPTYNNGTTAIPSNEAAVGDPTKLPADNISIVRKACIRTKKGEHQLGRAIQTSSESKKGSNTAAAKMVASLETVEVQPNEDKGTTAGPSYSNAASVAGFQRSDGALGERVMTSLASTDNNGTSMAPANEAPNVDSKKGAAANSDEILHRGPKISIVGNASSHTKEKEHEFGHTIRRSSESKKGSKSAAAPKVVVLGTTEVNPGEKAASKGAPTKGDGASLLATSMSEGSLDERAEIPLGTNNTCATSKPPFNLKTVVDPKNTAALPSSTFDCDPTRTVPANETSQVKHNDTDVISTVASRAAPNVHPGERLVTSTATTKSGATSTVLLVETSEVDPGDIAAATSGHPREGRKRHRFCLCNASNQTREKSRGNGR
ncbi:hypothetical protein HPB48_015311 [Haemaphysalis longicornis]|uniref:Globin domain-containing protein n=1 Tax=Haemaphysalis longicornis TaxID=44386 RepID=A0A9J6GU76_HAELO|nr:hypothetical protein HPB48_015311 [Haemaphysalis longicornis]